MTGSREALRARGDRRNRVWPVAASGAAVPLVSLSVALWAGGLGTPHNDDWSYIRAAEAFAEEGEVKLFGWNRMALVGQSVPAGALLGLLGGGVTTLQMINLVAATASVVLGYALARLFLEVRPSLLAASTLLFFPEFWGESTSFMTEVPALTLALACLYCGCVAVRSPAGRRDIPLFLAAVAFGLWAVTVREQAVAAPAAVLFAAGVRWWGTRRLLVVGAAALGFLAGVAAFEAWRRGLPGGDPFELQRNARGALVAAAHLLFSVGLMVAPISLAMARWRHPGTWAGIGVSVALALLLVFPLGQTLFLGNYLRPQGGYEAIGLGARPGVIPTPLWDLVQILAVVSAGVLLLLATTAVSGARRALRRPLRRQQRRQQGDAALLIVAVFGVLTVVGALAQTLVGQDPYLRYFLAIPLAVAVLVLRFRPRALRSSPRPGVAVVLGAALTVMAVVLTASTLRSDRDRWEAAERLVAAGVDPMDIAAGFDWSGYHSSFYAGQRVQAGDFVARWTRRFADARECFVISMGALELADYELVEARDGIFTYRLRGGC